MEAALFALHMRLIFLYGVLGPFGDELCQLQ